jgi:hypothetical protein
MIVHRDSPIGGGLQDINKNNPDEDVEPSVTTLFAWDRLLPFVLGDRDEVGVRHTDVLIRGKQDLRTPHARRDRDHIEQLGSLVEVPCLSPLATRVLNTCSAGRPTFRATVSAAKSSGSTSYSRNSKETPSRSSRRTALVLEVATHWPLHQRTTRRRAIQLVPRNRELRFLLHTLSTTKNNAAKISDSMDQDTNSSSYELLPHMVFSVPCLCSL